MTLPASLAWRHSIYCALHDGKPCNCKDDDDTTPVVRDPEAWAAVAKAGR